ncbi:hypothetical protein ACFFHK_05335 [Gallibacterium trehalosifermentans]|uniref:Beta-methylgalactoside transporter inner membrane component n=1 Tax=Gallibacterium trehalosifermentans TaxID=516935 RepID=A0ABV6H188_9PAST
MNFVRILQESSYFVRNRYPIIATFTMLYALNTLILYAFFNPFDLEMLQAGQSKISSSEVFLACFNLFISLVLNIWFILTIDQVSTNRVADIFACVPMILQKIVGFVGYNLLIMLVLTPFIIGASIVLTINSLGGGGDLQFFFICAFFLLISVYFAARVILLPIAYLVEPGKKGFKALYQLVNVRRSYLAILVYLVLVYFIPMYLSGVIIELLGENLLILSIFINAFINLFSLIFAYRFYHIFIKSNSL